MFHLGRCTVNLKLTICVTSHCRLIKINTPSSANLLQVSLKPISVQLEKINLLTEYRPSPANE